MDTEYKPSVGGGCFFSCHRGSHTFEIWRRISHLYELKGAYKYILYPEETKKPVITIRNKNKEDTETEAYHLLQENAFEFYDKRD